MSARPATEDAIAAARAAQAYWADLPVAHRLAVIRHLRSLIADGPGSLLRAGGIHVDDAAAEVLTSQIIPLADACRFLEREAVRLLAPQKLGRRGRPWWLLGVRAEVWREPYGVVLIVGPGNYPLFLPGVQALQALVVGNAVLLKPAPGHSRLAEELGRLLGVAGLPRDLYRVLDENARTVRRAASTGVDKVVLTGSAATGREVLGHLAPRLTPATLELSGSGAVFVLPGADLGQVAAALAFSLRLNGGATCIAPRRVFVQKEQASELEDHLRPRVAALPAVPLTAPARTVELLADALRRGARLSAELPAASDGAMAPVIVLDAGPELELLKADLMAPVLALIGVDGPEQALALDAQCPYALGTAIFGPEPAARQLAHRVRAGSVTINDLIVPTADPRLPFGGRGESGYGVTRGGAGLLEFTTIKAMSLRQGRFRPHYEAPKAGDRALFEAYLQATHGGSLGKRLRALVRLLRPGANRGR